MVGGGGLQDSLATNVRIFKRRFSKTDGKSIGGRKKKEKKKERKKQQQTKHSSIVTIVLLLTHSHVFV